MRTRIKICGLTRPEDARYALELGADFLGLVLAESPRRVVPRLIRGWVEDLHAEYPRSLWVGVFARPIFELVEDAIGALGLDLVQLHALPPGSEVEAPCPWICAVPADHLERASDPQRRGPLPWAVLIDAPSTDGSGGTGRVFDWSRLDRSNLSGRLFLAGGLGPDNVADAIRAVRPFAVDASSRLESAPGRKDPARLAEFFRRVREFDAQDAA